MESRLSYLLEHAVVELGDFQEVKVSENKKFRSVAEKTFAFELKNKNIEFIYEKKKYIRKVVLKDSGTLLGYGINKHQYTPDFYLPKQKLFIEIKSQGEPLDDDLRKKYWDFGQWIKSHGDYYMIINMPFKDRDVGIWMTNFGSYDDHQTEVIQEQIKEFRFEEVECLK